MKNVNRLGYHTTTKFMIYAGNLTGLTWQNLGAYEGLKFGRIEETKNDYSIFMWISLGRRPLGRPGEDRKTQLKDGSSRKSLYGWKEEVISFDSSSVQALYSATTSFVYLIPYIS
jgi:hypothetical protein